MGMIPTKTDVGGTSSDAANHLSTLSLIGNKGFEILLSEIICAVWDAV
jgi:hypothetical protein